MPLAPPPPTSQNIDSRQYRDWFYSIYALLGKPGAVLGTMAYENANSVTITGGSIGGVGISGSTINNTPIGNSTPSTIVGTSVTSTGQFNGSGAGLTNVPYTSVTTIPYGAFHDTTTQTAAANTITAITFNSTDYSNNVSRGSPTSRIVVSKAGTYSVTFSLQGANTASQIDNITVWFRINGTDVPTSAGVSAIPARHGAIDGQLVFGWTAFYTFVAGDYLQMMWTTDSGTSSLTTYPVGTSPVHPLSPSAAISLNYIAP